MNRKTAFITVLILASCAISPPDKALEPTEVDTADDMLAEIRLLAAAGEYRELRKAGKAFLELYADEEGSEEVRLLAGRANMELDLLSEAEEMLLPILEGDNQTPARVEANVLMSDIDRARGLFVESADKLLFVLSDNPDNVQRERATRRLNEIVGLLSYDQLNVLGARYGSGPGVDVILEGMLAYAKDIGDTTAARQIWEKMSEEGFTDGFPVPSGTQSVILPVYTMEEDGVPAGYRIGLLCPLSGRFSSLGEAFLQGASLALKEARARGIEGLDLVVGDTGANPLVARSAARRLIAEENVGAIVGGVLSTPTIAAAQVAEYEETVLLSPVATNEGIYEIGDWVFQTVMDIETEILATADVACRVLGMRRVGFLSVEGTRSRRIEQLFRSEVDNYGGELCVVDYYPEGSTDFKDHIEKIREAAPEALLIASDTEDLVLILPQISYYEFGVQLLGFSTWNSKRLLRMVGRDMEGAIFPVDESMKIDEELYLSAAALVGEQVGDINPFLISGYKGVRTIIEAMNGGGPSGDRLRAELSRLLHDRRHPFLELVENRGIPFHTVRGERLEVFTVLNTNP